MNSAKCPGCGGFSSLAEPHDPERRRCQSCGRLFAPDPGEPATLPPAPMPTDRDRATVDALVVALVESGDIVRAGRRYSLEGVELGTSLRQAKDAVYQDSALADVCAALVASDIAEAGEGSAASSEDDRPLPRELTEEGEDEDAAVRRILVGGDIEPLTARKPRR